MTHEQYSRAQRALGVLEGYGYGLPENANAAVYHVQVEILSGIIDDLMKNEEEKDGPL